MIPSAFVRVDNFPLTSSGKIDYRSLPKASQKIKANFIKPDTEDEKHLTKIWSDAFESRR